MILTDIRSWALSAVVVAGLLAGPLVASAGAAPVTVPGSYPTIQLAINAVVNGSLPDGTTIDVQAGSWPEALSIGNTAKSLTVRGVSGAGATFVDAAGKGAAALTVFRATGRIVFTGLTFRHGAPATAAGGGFVIQESSPSFANCIFELNTSANGGGGGALFTSNATFSGCIIRNNSAARGGGGVLILSGSSPVFTACDIVSNAAGTNAFDGVGGGVQSSDSSPTFHGSHIKLNTSKFAGGGIYHAGMFGSPYGPSALLMDDSEVSDNISSPFSAADSPTEGGGIHIEDNAVATLTRTRILRNVANTGGGLNAYRARYDVVDSVIDSNQAAARTDGGLVGGIGGGINALSNNPSPSTGPVSVVNLTRTLVRNNVGLTGGGIVVTGDINRQATLVLSSSVVDKNQAQNQGGGVLVSHAGLTATNSMIIRNNVSVSNPAAGGQVGGGIDITTFSSANISGTTIAHNFAGTFGGGIFMFAGSNTLTMSASNVYDNTASVRGGGLFIGDASQSGTVQTSMILDNSSGPSSPGQINEEACSAVQYQGNTIASISGAPNFSGCTPLSARQSGTVSTPFRFEQFLAVPSAGISSTLAWSVARATSVTIAGMGTWTSPVNSPTGTFDVTSSATYSLTATATSLNGGSYSAVTAGFTSVQPSPPPPPPPTRGHIVDGDFDGDGKADVTVFRPSTGIWYDLQSSTGTAAFYQWGLTGDMPVPGDYDGDGKTDIAVFRPSTGIFYVLQSSTGTAAFYKWGLSSDIPVPGDYDGDGKTDVAVFRPSTGIWYILQSSTGTGAFYQWGLNGDIPVPGDYDGDGKTDAAVFRPSTGIWYVLQSSTGAAAFYQWGLSTDIPVRGDFDGDGKTDVAVFRPSTGIWYVLQSSTGTGAFYQWGLNGDIPVPGDYDGDGKTDVAVFRPSTGISYVVNSSTGNHSFYQWGLSSDIPILKR